MGHCCVCGIVHTAMIYVHRSLLESYSSLLLCHNSSLATYTVLQAELFDLSRCKPAEEMASHIY